MNWLDFINTFLFPAGLGLLGFIEPCSIGATLLFIKFLQGKDAPHKIMQVCTFAVIRVLFMGVIGLLAAVLGMAFEGFQKGVWIIFGIAYVLIGGVYLSGKYRPLAVAIGPSISWLSGMSGSAALGIVFAFNIPACAGPLIFALLGTAAAGRALATGFTSLAIFGIALSLPLIAAVLIAPARRALDRLAGLSVRLSFMTGVVMIILGIWSVGFGLFVTPR